MPSKGALRKAEIVDGLQRVMAESGYGGASVSAIARSAGLAPGLVHYHFANKQAVLLALVERLAMQLRHRFETRDVAGLAAEQRLDALIDALLGLGEDADPAAAACWAQIGAEAQRQPEVRELFDATAQQTRAQLEALLTECGAREPRSAATALLCAIEGAYRLGAGAPATLPSGTAATLVKRLAKGVMQ